jgi:hypothetical protein
MHSDDVSNNDGRDVLSMGFTRGPLGDEAIGDSSAGTASRSAPSGGLPESTSMVATTSAATRVVATLVAAVATATDPSGHVSESATVVTTDERQATGSLTLLLSSTRATTSCIYALPTDDTVEALKYPTVTRLIRHQKDEAIKLNLNYCCGSCADTRGTSLTTSRNMLH